MIIGKKGQGLSMTVIVVAILALVILVILLLVLTGKLALFGGKAQECPGVCSGWESTMTTAAEAKECPDGYTRLGPGSMYIDKTTGRECEGHCCISVGET